MTQSRRVRGTTLVELLLAVVFLGISASAMLNAIGAAQSQASTVRYRAIATSLAYTEMSLARADARQGTLAVGTTNTVKANTGIPTVTVTRQVTSVSGTTNMYEIIVSVTYSRSVKRATRTDVVKLDAFVRQPDA